MSFDACPTGEAPGFAADVVQFLRDSKVPATFFISGAWAETNASAVRTLSKVPFFELALHGQAHPSLVDAPPALVRDEIVGGKATLARMGIRTSPLFRPPFGDMPPGLAAIARQNGVMPVLFDTGLGDPDRSRSAEILERDAIRWVQAGSIILLHVNGRGYATAQTVKELVPLLQSRGYRFVTVSELARLCDMPSP